MVFLKESAMGHKTGIQNPWLSFSELPDDLRTIERVLTGAQVAGLQDFVRERVSLASKHDSIHNALVVDSRPQISHLMLTGGQAKTSWNAYFDNNNDRRRVQKVFDKVTDRLTAVRGPDPRAFYTAFFTLMDEMKTMFKQRIETRLDKYNRSFPLIQISRRTIVVTGSLAL